MYVDVDGAFYIIPKTIYFYEKIVGFQVMRLESCKRLGIGGSTGISRLSSERSASLDSTDEDSKIRLDDPSLRLHIADSPTNPPELSFGDLNKNGSATKDDKTTLDFDPNMNTHTATHAYLPKV